MAGIGRCTQCWGVLLLTLFSILASNHHQARGQTSISDNTWAIVTVQCFAFAGPSLQSNYGLWWMQQDGLSSLAFNAVDVATTEIDCHFVSLANGAHQWFPLYKASGLSVACGTDCQWTIEDGGFFVLDPVTNSAVQLYNWLAAPDNWTEPQ
ncbi:unnamed protein product [Calypogeia fissa]